MQRRPRGPRHNGPAVDVPRLPRDVIALRGREEQREMRDVVRTRDAPGRGKAEDGRGRITLGERALAAGGRFAPARVDAAGTDRVDGDAVAGELLGHDLREPDHAEL